MTTPRLLSIVALFALLCLIGPSQGRDNESASLKTDPNKAESPARPQPNGLTFIDQGTHDKRLKGYRTPAGFKVEIVAEAPTVINPVGMTFADDGTPFVIEWVPSPGDEWRETPEIIKYKDGSTRKVATMKKKKKDIIKTLSFNKAKGVYDKATTVLEDELPSTVLLHDGWLYTASRGTVRRFKQSKKDGKFDKMETIAKGFCGFHHHQVSGLTIGNDGLLYITSGDDDNVVEGSDGSRATVLRTGGIFRCKPDGSKMETFALGFRNPYRDVAFDLAGNMFHVDNDNEDNSKFMGCRLMHIPEGADFGWRLYHGARCCRPDHVRGAAFGELPGKMPSLLKTGRGAPAGLLIYNDTRLPEEYRGLLFYPDVFRRSIRAYQVEQAGCSFKVTHEFEFMTAPNDPLFRPCQMVVGPDGAIYIVDWRTNSGGAGKLWGDGKNGRIYRVSWSGTKEQEAIPLRGMDSWSKIASLKDDELIKTLSSEEASFRERARKELVKRGDKNRKALLKLVNDDNVPLVARINTLGALMTMYDGDVQKEFLKALDDSDAEMRKLAADALGLCAKKKDKDVHNGLLKALADDDLMLRRACALAMARLDGPGAADNIAATLSFEKSKDVFLKDGYARALEMLGKKGIDALVALADSGVQKDSDLVADVFMGLRTRPAYDALPSLLNNPHLNAGQRADLIRSATNYILDPPVSLDPLVTWMTKQKSETAAVKKALLTALGTPGTVKNAKAGEWVVSLLGDTSSELRLAAYGAVDQMRLTGASSALIKTLGKDDTDSNEQLAIVKALRVLPSKDASSALAKFLAATKGTSPTAQTLRREAFLSLAAIDQEGARKTAINFLSGKDVSLQREAINVLGTTAKGATQVGKLFLDKKLPKELLPEVSAALRKHAKEAAVGKILGEVMKLGLKIGTSPAEVKRIRDLVKAKGDAMRGRALYLNSKTLACVNCHVLEGVGGNVGPALTKIWQTHTVEKIIESMIEPSKEIKEGFQTYQATTKKGQVYQGLKIAQTKMELHLREASGKDVRLQMKDVEKVEALKTSLMPDNVVSQLSLNEFLDLVAFLKSQSAQESLRGMALEFSVVGPFGDDLRKAYAPETKADVTASYDGKKWQQAQAEPTGYLDLKAIFKADKVSAYALTRVHSPKAQKATMYLGSDDTVRVWLNGKQVHEHTVPRSAKMDEDKVTVELNAGWNVVLVKVVNGVHDHGLYLRFAGEGLKVARAEGK